MGLPIQDGFPSVGAGTNLAGVDADQHLTVTLRASAFRTLGVYRTSLTSSAYAPTVSANSILFAMSVPALGWPALLVVKSVSVSAIVTSTITTAVPFDLALFLSHNNNSAMFGGGTSGYPAFAVPPEAMRTSMGAFQANLRLGFPSHSGVVDTNPIARIQGNTGTAVGNLFFQGRNPQVLYSLDHDDHHPIILSSTSTLCDFMYLENPFAGPATGTFTITVNVEWLEVAAY